MRNQHLRCLLCVLTVAILGVAAAGQKQRTAGQFTDRAGAKHPWSVTPAGTLIWDGQAYIPIGGAFWPRWLAEGQTEENWKQDSAALDALKAKGVTDLLIRPGRPLEDLPPAAIQRLVDRLDQGGFRYGVALGGGVRDTLSGTYVHPSTYRVAGVREGQEITWRIPDADYGRWVIVDKTDGTQIVREGVVRFSAGAASVVATGVPQDGATALLFPHRTPRGRSHGVLPDLWTGFDIFRDRLLGTLGQLKFGPGLRFWLDPLADPLGFGAETEYLIPDSPAFRVEFEAFLARRYPSIDELQNAWSVVERGIKDHRQAAGLLPMWTGSRGVPFLFDLVSGARQQVAGADSRYWTDVRECRDQSIVNCMNQISSMLKREIAGVPVVFTRTSQHRNFANASVEGGFDGLAAVAYGHGAALVTAGADSTWVQARDALHSTWFLVTETMDASGAAKTKPGYASREVCLGDLDWLRGIGARGVFVNGFQVLPEAAHPNQQMVRQPEQLGWLADYRSRLEREAAPGTFTPAILPFPVSASGFVEGGLIGGGGVWWVPSLHPGSPLDYGWSYAGYTIALPDGDATVLWSLQGARETRLAVADPRRVDVRTPDGTPVPVKIDLKGKMLRVVLDETPRVFRTNGQSVVPVEAIEDVLVALKAMVARALAAKLPAETMKYSMDRAETKVHLHEYEYAYGMARTALTDVVELLQPFVWREAERADATTFTETVSEDGAGAGGALVLDTTTAPGRAGYAAQYRFGVPADDTYDIWLACSPAGPAASPYAWLLDTGDVHTSDEARGSGATYGAGRYAWVRLGRQALTRGAHTFTIRINERAQSGSYAMRLDSFLVTRLPFAPHGTLQPTPVESATPAPGK